MLAIISICYNVDNEVAYDVYDDDGTNDDDDEGENNDFRQLIMTISLTFYWILTPSHNILDVHINEYDKCILSNGTRIVTSNAVNITHVCKNKNCPHYVNILMWCIM